MIGGIERLAGIRIVTTIHQATIQDNLIATLRNMETTVAANTIKMNEVGGIELPMR
jgi:hypothetical protein